MLSVCCGWMGLPQDPAWRSGAGVLQCRACPQGLSRAPLPDSSGKDRQTSVAGSAAPWPVIQGITDRHSVLSRSWTHHRSVKRSSEINQDQMRKPMQGLLRPPAAHQECW